MTRTTTAPVGVLVPVKPPAIGKSRLASLPDEARTALVAAFALDTVIAALSASGVATVLAVTDDHRFAEELRGQGCLVIPDGVTGDLNRTLAQGAAELVRRHPGLRVAALCADLPSVTSEEVDAALAAAAEHDAAFVPDAAGSGTVLLAAQDRSSFLPAFGEESRRAHRDGGAAELALDLPGLRHDVDTPTDLAAALARGVGRFTERAAARLELGPESTGPPG